MGRIMAIDFGTKRIGIAVTDPQKIIASPLETVHSSDISSFLADYLSKENVETIVVGYPLRMNNSPSDSVKHIGPFIRKIKKQFPQIPVQLADERFTSRMAMRTMIEGGLKKKDRQDKSIVDKISAAIILRSFLDAQKNRKVNDLK